VSPSQRSKGERDVLAVRSQFTLGVGAFGATVSSSGPDSEFLAWRGQLQYVRLLAAKRRMVVRSDVQLTVGELLPSNNSVEAARIQCGATVRVLCWPWGGIFGSAELRYRIVRTGDKQGVLQVTPFVDFGKVWTNSGPRATLEANTLLSAGLGLRWQYGQRWNAGGGGGIPSIGFKSSDRSWQ
jgi:hemolysin activation/secretion protein